MAVRRGKDGRYAVEFQQSGRRVFRRLHEGASRLQAEALERKLRNDIFVTERLGERPEITLEDAIARWLENRLPHLKDKRNPAHNAKHLAPFVVGRSLREAPEAAREAVKSWSAKASKTADGRCRQCASPSGARDGAGSPTSHIGPATINRRLCVLKATAKYAWKQGWIDENVSGRISLLPGEGRREVYLTAAQVDILRKHAPSKQSEAAIVIAAYSGVRVGELLRLGTTAESSSVLLVPIGKTGKPRQVPIVSIIRPYLQALPLGLSYRQLVGEFWVARKAAKMPHVRFHDLRHSCASMLANKGVDLFTIGKILGHTSAQTTMRYAHFSDKTLRVAMRKIG